MLTCTRITTILSQSSRGTRKEVFDIPPSWGEKIVWEHSIVVRADWQQPPFCDGDCQQPASPPESRDNFCHFALGSEARECQSQSCQTGVSIREMSIPALLLRLRDHMRGLHTVDEPPRRNVHLLLVGPEVDRVEWGTTAGV